MASCLACQRKFRTLPQAFKLPAVPHPAKAGGKENPGHSRKLVTYPASRIARIAAERKQAGLLPIRRCVSARPFWHFRATPMNFQIRCNVEVAMRAIGKKFNKIEPITTHVMA